MSASTSVSQKGTGHAPRAERFLQDAEETKRHDDSLWFVRQKRDRAVAAVPDWEALREQAQAIKAHTMGQLAEYLEQFEAQATAAGAVVHWASDAASMRQQVGDILARHEVQRVVKSKSMLTEECGLNPYLEAKGMQVTDTDLGEWIVQLREEPPSHIVLPAIHLRRQQIGETFHKHVGSEAGAEDPEYLTGVARDELRQRFLQADAGITGVNFAVAETGSVVVCTNEGNADLGTTLPRLHIACMGIEKLVPRLRDLGVFTRLLARSATGQAVTTYTSHFTGPRPGCELHIVIVDNGRSQQLAREDLRHSLHCIRCGACMNTCPVYRRSGGHSYGTTVPGPIGSILSPGQDAAAHADLPFASSLCGSCTAVCPVQIDLHEQLLAWRQRLTRPGQTGSKKRKYAKAAAAIMRRPWLWRACGRVAQGSERLPRWLRYHPWNVWGRDRELPPMAKQSFLQWYKKHGEDEA